LDAGVLDHAALRALDPLGMVPHLPNIGFVFRLGAHVRQQGVADSTDPHAGIVPLALMSSSLPVFLVNRLKQIHRFLTCYCR